MKFITNRLLPFLALALLGASFTSPVFADTSHARIVRLSLVQGDVRFARSFQHDPLADTKANWETAVLNLPIREGYALSTEAGRAQIEFENGAMAFLGENTIVEFYDLSLRDGDRITRLVLRQGVASFYVHPDHGDYFSVTGGDFTVEALNRTRFRLENFDDGSSVNIQAGRATVLQNEKPTPLEKGQSFTVKALDAGNPILGRESNLDDFDKWVSGRVDSVVTATNSSQYVNSPNYTSGFSDLNSYGSWLSVAGFGYGWQPYGVGMGWSPFGFGYGGWYQDPSFGLTFIGSQPWGWLPYHYGGWVFSPAYGWVWIPSGFGLGYRNPVYWRPVTATWVHTGNTVGVVPVHPADIKGKTPLNLPRGVFPVQGKATAEPVTVNGKEKVSVLKNGPKNEVSGATLASAAAPTHAPRTLNATRGGTPQGSSILYDAKTNSYVNSGAAARTENRSENKVSAQVPEVKNGNTAAGTSARSSQPASVGTVAQRGVPARAPIAPAPARTSGGSSSSSASSSTVWNGGSSSGSSGSTSTPSRGSASSSGGSSRSGGSSGGGGRPR
jgi:hypothetical protein